MGVRWWWPQGVDTPAGVRWGMSGRSMSGGPGGEQDHAALAGSVTEGPGWGPQAVSRTVAQAVGRLGPGMSVQGVAWMRQVHGADVLEVREGMGPLRAVGTGDGMWTRMPGVVLGVKVADCVPVLLAAPGGVGVAHAGWRGVASGVVPATVSAMVAGLGGTAEAVTAVIGPCLGMAAFEVGPEVPQALRRAVPGWGSAHARRGRRDRWHVDLRGAVAAQLRDVGVRQIGHVRADTTGPDWFSYRGDGAHTGRQAGWVCRTA